MVPQHEFLDSAIGPGTTFFDAGIGPRPWSGPLILTSLKRLEIFFEVQYKLVLEIKDSSKKKLVKIVEIFFVFQKKLPSPFLFQTSFTAIDYSILLA